MTAVNKSDLRRGFTTGSCAAAAAKRAVALLYNLDAVLSGIDDETYNVQIPLPQGGSLFLPVQLLSRSEEKVVCAVVKDGGDDPDSTHGALIVVEASKSLPGVHIRGGNGVGVVTQPGLAVPVGEPAINPVPRKMIYESTKDLIPSDYGVQLTVSVPAGEELAKKTLNPKLGILGGISILGTTGIVEPMSEEAFKASLEPQLDVALASGCRDLLLTPGRMGQIRLVQRGVPEKAVVLISNFVGHMLDACARRSLNSITLWGHLGKLVKIAGGIFHTHSQVADARREIIVSHLASLGAETSLVVRIMEETITAEGAIDVISEAGYGSVFHRLAQAAGKKAEERLLRSGLEINVGVVMTDLAGLPIGWNQRAYEVGEATGWKLTK